MKKSIKGIIFIATLLLGVISISSFVYQDDLWDEEQLVEPADLAKKINNPKAQKPIILNVGPMDNIKYAREMGMGSTVEGMEKFKGFVDKLPLQQEIVVYCGCCKLENCPNVKKTMLYLDMRGYTNHKLLNIPTSLDEDWIDKGYPMAQ